MLGRIGSASEGWYVGVACDCTALVSSSGPTLHNDYIIHEYTVKTTNYVTSHITIHNAMLLIIATKLRQVPLKLGHLL